MCASIRWIDSVFIALTSCLSVDYRSSCICIGVETYATGFEAIAVIDIPLVCSVTPLHRIIAITFVVCSYFSRIFFFRGNLRNIRCRQSNYFLLFLFSLFMFLFAFIWKLFEIFVRSKEQNACHKCTLQWCVTLIQRASIECKNEQIWKCLRRSATLFFYFKLFIWWLCRARDIVIIVDRLASCNKQTGNNQFKMKIRTTKASNKRKTKKVSMKMGSAVRRLHAYIHTYTATVDVRANAIAD